MRRRGRTALCLLITISYTQFEKSLVQHECKAISLIVHCFIYICRRKTLIFGRKTSEALRLKLRYSRKSLTRIFLRFVSNFFRGKMRLGAEKCASSLVKLGFSLLVTVELICFDSIKGIWGIWVGFRVCYRKVMKLLSYSARHKGSSVSLYS